MSKDNIESEYNKLLEEAKRRGRETAKTWIPKLCDALEKEKLSNEDIRDRVEKDCIDIWSKATIRDSIADKYKNKQKQEAGKIGREKQLEEKQLLPPIQVPNSVRAEDRSNSPREQESRTFRQETQPQPIQEQKFEWPKKHRIDLKRFKSEYLQPRYSIIVFYHPDGSINWDKTKAIEVVD
jgi:hypothetical protein